jgi:hypothetical protein
VLQKLDEKQVYVIGGIVDHNRIKGHCHELALKAGWKTGVNPSLCMRACTCALRVCV